MKTSPINKKLTLTALAFLFTLVGSSQASAASACDAKEEKRIQSIIKSKQDQKEESSAELKPKVQLEIDKLEQELADLRKNCEEEKKQEAASTYVKKYSTKLTELRGQLDIAQIYDRACTRESELELSSVVQTIRTAKEELTKNAPEYADIARLMNSYNAVLGDAESALQKCENTRLANKQTYENSLANSLRTKVDEFLTQAPRCSENPTPQAKALLEQVKVARKSELDALAFSDFEEKLRKEYSPILRKIERFIHECVVYDVMTEKEFYDKSLEKITKLQKEFADIKIDETACKLEVKSALDSLNQNARQLMAQMKIRPAKTFRDNGATAVSSMSDLLPKLESAVIRCNSLYEQNKNDFAASKFSQFSSQQKSFIDARQKCAEGGHEQARSLLSAIKNTMQQEVQILKDSDFEGKVRSNFSSLLPAVENYIHHCVVRDVAVEAEFLDELEKTTKVMDEDFASLKVYDNACKQVTKTALDNLVSLASTSAKRYVDKPAKTFLERGEAVQEKLAAQLEKFQTTQMRCGEILQKNQKDFAVAQLKTLTARNSSFFAAKPACQSESYPVAKSYYSEIQAAQKKELEHFQNSDFEDAITAGYSTILQSTKTFIDDCTTYLDAKRKRETAYMGMYAAKFTDLKKELAAITTYKNACNAPTEAKMQAVKTNARKELANYLSKKPDLLAQEADKAEADLNADIADIDQAISRCQNLREQNKQFFMASKVNELEELNRKVFSGNNSCETDTFPNAKDLREKVVAASKEELPAIEHSDYESRLTTSYNKLTVSLDAYINKCIDYFTDKEAKHIKRYTDLIEKDAEADRNETIFENACDTKTRSNYEKIMASAQTKLADFKSAKPFTDAFAKAEKQLESAVDKIMARGNYCIRKNEQNKEDFAERALVKMQAAHSQFFAGQTSCETKAFPEAQRLLETIKKSSKKEKELFSNSDFEAQINQGYDSLLPKLNEYIGECETLWTTRKKQQKELVSKYDAVFSGKQKEFAELPAVKNACSTASQTAAIELRKKAFAEYTQFTNQLPDLGLAKAAEVNFKKEAELLDNAESSYTNLITKLDNYVYKCKKGIEQAEKAFAESPYKKNVTKYYQFFTAENHCESPAFAAAGGLKSELVDDFNKELDHLAGSNYEARIRRAYGSIIDGTQKYIDRCIVVRRENRKQKPVLAPEGAYIYVEKEIKNPITDKTETVMYPAGKVKYGTMMQYNIHYTIKNARYWHENRILSAKENFFGGVVILDSAKKAGISESDRTHLNRIKTYVFERNFLDQPGPVAKKRYIDLKVTSKVGTLRYFDEVKGQSGKKYNVLLKKADIPRGSVVRVDLTKIMPHVWYQRSNGQYVRGTKPFMKVKVLSFGKNTKLSSSEQKAIKNGWYYLYILSVDQAKVVNSVYNKRVPFRADTLNHKASWDKFNETKRWTYVAYEALENPANRHLVHLPPEDIKEFCPNFHKLSNEKRKIFWLEFFSTLANKESSFIPWTASNEGKYDADMEGTISSGLMAVSLTNAFKRSSCYQDNGCNAIKKQTDLYHPEKMLTCSIGMMSCLLKWDNCISCKKKDRNGNKNWAGIAAYWSNLRTSQEITCNDASACGSDGKVQIGNLEKVKTKVSDRLSFCTE